MNILLFNWRDPNNPQSGGAECVTMMHAKAWVRYGDRVTWFASSYRGAKPEEKIEGVEIIRRGNAVSVFFHALLYFRKNIKNIDCIVDEVHGIPYFAVLYAKKPLVLFLHEIAGDIWSVMYPWPIAFFGRLLERFFLWVYRGHTVWTDAESTVDELVHFGIPRRHCVVIPCPITDRPLGKKPVKNSQPTFIFVGRIVRMKRIEDILEAFISIKKALSGAQLWIVGQEDKKYKEELEDITRTAGISEAVMWYGKVSERKKLDLLKQSHALLHTSVKEGWGLVVLEAGSQWTPSVVYGVPGLVDTVKDQKTGIIVRSCDPSDVAREAVALYNDKCRYQAMQKEVVVFSRSFRWEDVTKQSRALITNAYEAA